MDRKEFIKKLAKTGIGVGCCGAVIRQLLLAGEAGPGMENWIPDLERRMIKGSETPDWRKAEKSALWIKWMVGHMDSMMDEEAKKKLLKACGRSCHTYAFGVASDQKATPEQAEGFLQFMEKGGTEIRRENGIITIFYSWGRDHQNPQGLILSDGYCMCPIVESGPPGLSASYCNCSAGYVGEMFERYLGRPTEVEILESLKSGGKDCRFKITAKQV
jgi:hypothetical protein